MRTIAIIFISLICLSMLLVGCAHNQGTTADLLILEESIIELEALITEAKQRLKELEADDKWLEELKEDMKELSQELEL